MHALQGLTPEALVARFPELTLSEARKVTSTVIRRGGAALGRPVEQVRRAALEALRARGHVPSLSLLAEQASAVDPFVKYLLETADGERVEAVRIPLERAGRFSVCVSSQVGCALACAFCATGRLGLRRNLEVWEIIEQIRVVRERLPAGGRVHGVVFQGMGEPLSNAERVLEAIRVLTEPSGLAIDARAVTVCTSGLPAGIRRLAVEAPKVRLGLSLASARPSVRRSLMPIDAAHGLEAALEAAAFHAETTGLAPLFAVTLLAGTNDTAEDARALAALVHAFAAKTGRRPRLSIIPYNAIAAEHDPFERASDAAEDAFRAVLRDLGVFTHKRYSGGGDVGAACGQLAGRGDARDASEVPGRAS